MRRVRRKGQVREEKCWEHERKGSGQDAGGRDKGRGRPHRPVLEGRLRCGRGDHRVGGRRRGDRSPGELGWGCGSTSEWIRRHGV